jgi:hypothetical protein
MPERDGAEDDQLKHISLKLNEKKEKDKRESKITAKATIYVIFACTVSASSGLLFGYECGFHLSTLTKAFR